MKISYNWLKDYIDYLPSPEESAEILTNVGLEVENIDEHCSVKGGLEGIVIGEVISCEKHPDADKLSLTKVDTGTGEFLSIVCGAPNVKEGQKVPVATLGTTLYKGKESFTIQKTKIRGQLSEGMICAEDEIGLGNDHSGIMVLDPSAKIGTPAAEYFGIYKDVVFEIGITPNRIDGASHYGVARDIAAFLGKDRNIILKKASVDKFRKDNNDYPVQVKIENTIACKRYSGLTISGIKVAPSPKWLQDRLKAIGLNPINNVVDITNYVLHETGQPLHAFDAAKVKGNSIIVKNLPEGTPFLCLDETERKLSSEDLMICNSEEGMCIAGVFGGLESGVKDSTESIFLESACFNPVNIRRTSKRHLLFTDSSFRFERGSDPENTVYALKRAALLIAEIAGGKISSEIIDIYPHHIENQTVSLRFSEVARLTGHDIPANEIIRILKALDFTLLNQSTEELKLSIPTYRVDVTRPADVIEEILRIYGFNNIPVSEHLQTSLSYLKKPDKEKLISLLSDLLASNGFNEIMSNSLSKSSYYESLEADPSLVKIFNPLSSDLNAMRKTLLFGGLEAIAYNTNRQNQDLRLFETGNIYALKPGAQQNNNLENYQEEERISLFLSGAVHKESWASTADNYSFFHLKAYTELLFKRLGFEMDSLSVQSQDHIYLDDVLCYSLSGQTLALIGKVKTPLIKEFDIKNEVFFADIHWGNALKSLSSHRTIFHALPKYPIVKRDLSMIIEKSVSYNDIKKLAEKTGGSLVKKIDLFDVYEGDRIEKGKKSYALSFFLRDENKTLTDQEIDGVMKKIEEALVREIGVQIRK
jgi:phenylalanyl-tRNA synthetase beta chain